MKYSERENFYRVINWDNPSHVCAGIPTAKSVSYFGAWPSDVHPSVDCQEWRDVWGVTWIDADGEAFPSGAAVTPDRIDDLRVPDPHSGKLRQKLEEDVAKIDREQLLLSVGHPFLLYEKGFNILGATEFLTTLAADEEAANLLLDKMLGFELGVAEEYIRFKPEQILTADDYGMQDRLAISPEMWRKYFKPRLQQLYDLYRSELGDDVIINHHSCGHVMPILEDFIDLGVRILNPLQTTANDLVEVAKIVDHRLVVLGAIDGQHILPFGTPEDVKEEVFLKLDTLWNGGGYLPSPEKMLGVSEENVQAMRDAIVEWGQLNVEK